MPNRLCGEVGGFRTKSGELCKFILPEGENACRHHSEDRTRDERIKKNSKESISNAKIPNIKTNDFRTLDDCIATKAGIVKELGRKQPVDFRRLELILKCATSASGDHATKAVEKQNELLLALGGHGAGVAMLQRLREAPIRVLPGRRKALDVETIVNAEVEEPEDQQEHTA